MRRASLPGPPTHHAPPPPCRGISSNQITGTIPAALGSLASLTELCAPEPYIWIGIDRIFQEASTGPRCREASAGSIERARRLVVSRRIRTPARPLRTHARVGGDNFC